MSDSIITNELLQAQRVLQQFITNSENVTLIEAAGTIMVEALQRGNKLISCGNGGSMCDAMHFAEELTGRYRNDRAPLPALAISDPSYITCTANDFGFEEVFSRYIDAFGKPGDVLLAISTSGNSKNITLAAEKAKQKGMKVISLSGNSGGLIKSLSDICICVQNDGFSDRIQEVHIKIIHILIHYIEKNNNYEL
jgi:D-sedoheptulose 7-phosphate isomerase